MQGVLCDVCGALSDATDVRERRGSLVVSKPFDPNSNPLEVFMRGGLSADRYDLCGQCAAGFVAIIARTRESKL